MQPRLIGVGVGRTGTQSIQAALEILGVPCYGMQAVISSQGHATAWGQALSEGAPMDWESTFDGYGATIGWPMCFFAEELAERYPQAKFLVTYRDPESWFPSLDRSWKALSRMRLFRFVPKVRQVLGVVEPVLSRFGGIPPEHDAAVAAFEAHYQHVRSALPADRLVEYEVSQGWDPLCAALDLAVPDAPFPRANAGDGMLKRMIEKLVSGQQT